jgi:hypothetical protein
MATSLTIIALSRVLSLNAIYPEFPPLATFEKAGKGDFNHQGRSNSLVVKAYPIHFCGNIGIVDRYPCGSAAKAVNAEPKIRAIDKNKTTGKELF